MIKNIKNIFIIIILIAIWYLSIWNTTFANVYYVNLSPAQTYYYDPYKIKNNTSGNIFAPFSDSLWRITSNFAWGSSFSFWTKLDRTYTHWWFTISNAWYSWLTWWYGSCNVSCGWWTQYRSVWCNREDWNYVSDVYCSWAKPSTNQSCNTQPCYTYSWYTWGFWSCSASPYWWGFWACSVSCWWWYQYRTCYWTSWTSYRTVYCMRNDWASVTDWYCSWGKPTTSSSCSLYCSWSSSQRCNTQSCCPSWYTWNAGYGACIKPTNGNWVVNCTDTSTVAWWYKANWRCWDQGWIDFRKNAVLLYGYSAVYPGFVSGYNTTCLNRYNTTNLALCNSYLYCESWATYISNTNYCRK